MMSTVGIVSMMGVAFLRVSCVRGQRDLVGHASFSCSIVSVFMGTEL